MQLCYTHHITIRMRLWPSYYLSCHFGTISIFIYYTKERTYYMFTQKQLNSVDRGYFAVFMASPFEVKVKSKNTRHYWRILDNGKSCTILHSHQGDSNYHDHARANSLTSALNSIKKHDTYQLTHRKPEDNDYDYIPLLPDSEYFVF